MTDTPNPGAVAEQPTDERLTMKQRRFIEAYLISGNATAAAKAAGYSERTAAEQGHDNLRKPHIAAVIKRRFEANHMTADEALSRLAEMARGDISVFISGNQVNLAQHPEKLHLLRKVSEGRYGLSIEIQDQQAALEKILRATGRLEAQDAKPVIDVNLYINDVLQKLHGETIDGDQG